MKLELPEHLKTTEPMENIQVPVSLNAERPLNQEHLQELHEKLGMVSINPQQITAMRDMGIAAKELGILNTIRGTTLISQQTLANTMVDLSNVIEKQEEPDEKIKAARALGYLAGQLSRVNSGSAKMEGVVIQATQAKETKKRVSFPLGRLAGPIIDVTPKASSL